MHKKCMMQSDLPNFRSGVQGGTPPAGKENCVDRSASCIFCVFYIEIVRYISKVLAFRTVRFYIKDFKDLLTSA